MFAALFPTLLFLWGYVKGLSQVACWKSWESDPTTPLVVTVVTAFFLFLIKYTMDYRDFSTMKAIFIMPALPALLWLWVQGAESFVGVVKGCRAWLVVPVATICLLGGYVLSALALIVHLLLGGS